MKTLKLSVFLVATLCCLFSVRVSAQTLELKGEWRFKNDTARSYLAARGNFAYTLTVNRTLRIIDATDGTRPRLAKEIPVLTNVAHASGITVSGDHVYLLGFRDGGSMGRLEIINVSNPAQPVLTSALPLTGSWIVTPHHNLQVSGGYAYIGSGNAMVIVNVENPASPQQSQGFNLNDRPVFDVAINNGLAYLAMGVVPGGTRTSAGLEIVDISDPLRPQRVGGRSGFDPRTIYVSGTYAVLEDVTYGSVLCDVSNPSSPARITLQGALPSPGAVTPAYVYAGNGVYDFSAKPIPAKVGSFGTDAIEVAVSGNRLYCEAGDFGIYIFDIQNPIEPVFLGRYIHSLAFHAYTSDSDISASGNFLVMQDKLTGMHVIDISNPIKPQYLSNYPLRWYGTAMALGSRAYVTGRDRLGRGGLDIVDMTDPAHPTRMGSLLGEEYFSRELAGYGNYLYNELGAVIDVSNPAFPQKIGTFPLATGSVRRMKVVGNRLFTLQRGNYYDYYFRIYDLSQPNAPVFLGGYTNEIYDLGDFAISGSYAFLPKAPMQILSISNAANITLFKSQPGDSSSTYWIDASGSKVYRSRGPELTLEDGANPGGTLPATNHVGLYVWGIIAVGDYAYVLSHSHQFGLTSLNVYQGTLGPSLTVPRLWGFPDKGKVVVRWSTNFPGLKLYSTPDLSQPWQLVTPSLNREGLFFTFTNTSPTGSGLFYNLSE